MPRHLLLEITDRLNADLHTPDPDGVRRLDRFLSRLYGMPHHWEQARRVIRQLEDGDGVFTTGCDAGVPLALLCGLRRRRVSFAISFIDPSRPRTRFFGWILVLLLRRLLVLVTLDEQAATVQRSFGRRAWAVSTMAYTTDCRFFRPGDGQGARPERALQPGADGVGAQARRPMVAGCGAEQRDYRSLGEAVAPMDLDAKICFVSPNFSSKTRYSMPEPVPDNMDFQHYEFDDLRALYQQADAMVVPLLANRYSAGLTAMFEAIACECPVIITDSPGIINRLIAADLVMGVEVGSVTDLQQALKVIITDPDVARARARRARTHLEAHYSTDIFLERLDDLLAGLV